MSALHAVATADVPVEDVEVLGYEGPTFSFEVNDHFAFQFAMCFIVAMFLVTIFIVAASHTLGLHAAMQELHGVWAIR